MPGKLSELRAVSLPLWLPLLRTMGRSCCSLSCLLRAEPGRTHAWGPEMVA